MGACETKEPYSWGYDEHNGPKTWCEHYGAANGRRQSPIDINVNKIRTKNAENDDESGEADLSVHWKECRATCTNNGHTVCWSVENAGYVLRDSEKFNLVQFHYHIPSEHSFSRERSNFEIHFVHQNPKTEALLVLGFLYDLGASDEFLDIIIDRLPLKVGETAATQTVDLTKHRNLDHDYIHYNGSLTTPPCSEGVLWYVCTNKLQISNAQYCWFRACIPHDNSRPLQRKNKRRLTVQACSGHCIEYTE